MKKNRLIFSKIVTNLSEDDIRKEVRKEIKNKRDTLDRSPIESISEGFNAQDSVPDPFWKFPESEGYPLKMRVRKKTWPFITKNANRRLATQGIMTKPVERKERVTNLLPDPYKDRKEEMRRLMSDKYTHDAAYALPFGNTEEWSETNPTSTNAPKRKYLKKEATTSYRVPSEEELKNLVKQELEKNQGKEKKKDVGDLKQTPSEGMPNETRKDIQESSLGQQFI